MQHIKIHALYIFFLFGIISCSYNNNNNEDDYLNADTLKQYIKYSIDSTDYYFTRNDTINIFPKSIVHLAYLGDTTEIFYISKTNIGSEAYELGWGQSHYLEIRFYSIRHENEINESWNCPVLIDYQKYLDFFNQKSWKFIEIPCSKYVTNNEVSISEYQPQKQRQTYNKTGYDCEVYEPLIDQSDSKFEILSVEDYMHPYHGECLLLTGIFEATLFEIAEYDVIDTLQFTNGEFRILVGECPY